MDDNPTNPTGKLPKLRPYQVPPAEQKLRDDKEAAERLERIGELQQESQGAYKPSIGRRLVRFAGWLLLIVVLTAGIGGAVWWYFLREPMAQIATGNTTLQQADPTKATGNDAKAPTKHYESANFGLEFDYPEDWTVTDNSTKLTVVSPPKQSQGGPTSSASNQSQDKSQSPQTVVTIQARQASTPAFKNGSAIAIRASEKISYAKPSPTQRADSYLSFLSYAGSTMEGLDGVYVTGDNGYQVGQAIPQVDIAKADPLITVTFIKCSDSKCLDGGKPLTLSGKIWDDTTFAKPVKAMLQSIVVQ